MEKKKVEDRMKLNDKDLINEYLKSITDILRGMYSL